LAVARYVDGERTIIDSWYVRSCLRMVCTTMTHNRSRFYFNICIVNGGLLES
jgi:hypothetical protein